MVKSETRRDALPRNPSPRLNRDLINYCRTELIRSSTGQEKYLEKHMVSKYRIV